MPSTPALAVPSASQLAWQDLEIGMFIHFAPNTWQNSQKDNLTTPVSAINPDKLDVAQWVDVAEAMHAEYIIFVAKHVGGFCMWDSATTGYSISKTPWRGGGGDVCAELAAECARRNMPLGFYLSPRDDHFGIDTGGRARSGSAEHQALYDRVYQTQLTELLTGYGKLVEIWFDGSANGEMVRPLIERHQPEAVVFQSSAASIRWIGNEDGVAPYPTWNAMPARQREWDPETDNSGLSPAVAATRETIWLPAECDVPIRADWFWTTDNAATLKRLDHLLDLYYRSVGHGCNLLLNHTPDVTGLIPEADAARSTEFGAEITRRFGTPLAEARDVEPPCTLTLDAPASIGHIIMQEDIRHGERISEYELQALLGETWQTVAHGSAIGHKKIDRIEPVTATAIRLNVVDSLEAARLRSFAVYG